MEMSFENKNLKTRKEENMIVATRVLKGTLRRWLCRKEVAKVIDVERSKTTIQ